MGFLPALFLIIAVLCLAIPWPFAGGNWIAFALALVALILLCVGYRGHVVLSKSKPVEPPIVKFHDYNGNLQKVLGPINRVG